MSVTVLVPWRGGCRHREDAWAWVRAQYERRHPKWNVIRCQVSGVQGQPWVKADAVMPAIERSEAKVLVVADADVWCEGIGAAAQAVRRGATWALPHRHVHRLSQPATAAVLRGDADPWSAELEMRPYPGVAGGGIVVASRETLLSVPLDRRFVGWGGEDAAWGIALRCLAKAPWRGQKPLIHLWHPPQERVSQAIADHPHDHPNRQLWLRYVRAKKRPAELRALLKEAA